MVKVRPFGQVADRLVEPLVTALADALDGAPAIECAVGPATRRLGGQWLGAPVNGLDDLAAAVFEATAEIVPVTHPQPFQADIVLARGRVLATWPARRSAPHGRPTRCSSSPTGRAHTTSGSTTWLSFDWVGDGSFSPRSATAQPIDASVDRRLPGAGTLPRSVSAKPSSSDRADQPSSRFAFVGLPR